MVSGWWSGSAVSPKVSNGIRHIRARLNKTNDVVSKRFVKISIVNISYMLIFFAEKMQEAFALQKLLSFFQQKISVYLVIKL